MNKSLIFFFFVLMFPSCFFTQTTHEAQLTRAQVLYRATNYDAAAKVADSVVATPSGAKDYVAWTVRGFVYYYIYIRTDKKILNSAKRDTVLSSILNSMKLSPDSDYISNNKKILQNLAAHYFNNARELLQDATNYNKADYAYNRYKAILKISDSSINVDQKDAEYYAAQMSVATEDGINKWTRNNKADTNDIIFFSTIVDKLTTAVNKMKADAANAPSELEKAKRESDADMWKQPVKVNRALLLYNYVAFESKRYQKENIDKQIALGLLSSKNKLAELELQKQSDNIELLTTTAELSRLQAERQKRGIEALEKEKSLQKLVVEKQQLEAKEKEEEISQQRFVRNISLIGILLLLITVVVIYRSLDKNKKQKQIISEQKHLVEEKHKEITDSINYAERIQRALLPSKSVLDEHMKDHFILFRPKDIVSGDFYWATTLANGEFLFVTADSTGHGVPGAIMSILNIACLKESVVQGITAVDEIFNQTRALIIENLKHDGSSEGGKDGMDACGLCFDFLNYRLSVAAAFNSVWIIRKKELFEITADRMPVGKHKNDQVPFKRHNFMLQKGDVVYSLTDGYPDQFGGENGKKYMYKRLKEFLVKNSHLSMTEQKQHLEAELKNWMANNEQVDDITVVGIRV